MGMMDMAPMPQEAPQGMMGGQPPEQQGGGYNGVVQDDGKPIQVVEGVAEIDGKKYLVSDDGMVVVDDQRRVVGYIENGQFMPMTEEHSAKLKQMGMTE